MCDAVVGCVVTASRRNCDAASAAENIILINVGVEVDSDRVVFGLAISLPLNLVDELDLVEDDCFGVGAYGDIVKIVSTVVRSRHAGESVVAGTAGIVTVVGWYGPSKMHFLKASPFDLMSMYLKKRDCH
uniref:Uncharacterized protein n=1 Tax=Tanacetum cinerariifolium TaxID=118510 RepID=A0A699IVJ5_TANCI|nr:hypothetical protein [Tanacetum cinerariifolium]